MSGLLGDERLVPPLLPPTAPGLPCPSSSRQPVTSSGVKVNSRQARPSTASHGSLVIVNESTVYPSRMTFVLVLLFSITRRVVGALPCLDLFKGSRLSCAGHPVSVKLFSYSKIIIEFDCVFTFTFH